MPIPWVPKVTIMANGKRQHDYSVAQIDSD